MDKEKSWIDRGVLAVSVMAFLSSTGYIVAQRLYFYGEDRTDVEVIAKVARSSNDVRRKFGDDIVWRPIRSSDRVYQADSIFTDTDSDAQISFDSGATVDIDPSSLVVIRKDGGGAWLDLQSGTISGRIENNQNLRVATKGHVQELRSQKAQVKISLSDEGKTQLTVVSGKAELSSSGSKKSTTLTQNQTAVLSKKGDVEKIETYPINLMTPESNQTIWKKAGQKTSFRWDTDGSSEQFQIVVARDPKLKNVVMTKTVSGTEADLELPAQQGSLFWQVRGLKGKDTRDSLVRRFGYYTESAPQIVSPTQGQTIHFALKEMDREPSSAAERGGAPALLQWEDSRPASAYSVQVATDAQCSHVVWEGSAEGFQTGTKTLPEGRYYWRVRANDDARPDAPWSSVTGFQVEGRALRPAPEILGPTGTLALKESEQLDVNFQWKKYNNARFYTVEVSKDPSFNSNSIVSRQRLNETEWKWNPETQGDYFWRVRGITQEGQVTIFSQPTKLAIRQSEAVPESAPAEVSPEPAPATPPQVETPPPAPVEPPKKKPTPMNLKAPTIQQKKIKFKMGFLDRGILSSLFSLVIGDAYAQVQGPALTWGKVEGAAGYQVEIASDAKFKNVAIKEKSKQNFFQWEVKEPGVYFWRVRAFDSEGRMGPPSQPGLIDISVVSAIQNMKTRVIPNDEEDVAKAKPEVEFSWSEVQHAQGYEVFISENDKFRGKVMKKIVSSAKEVIELPKYGTYFWKLRPLGKDNAAIGEFSFTQPLYVTKQMTLAGPELIRPETDAKIPMKEGQEKADVVMEWKALKGAKRYRIEVATSESFESLTTYYVVKGTSALAKALPRGTNYWRVKAEGGPSVSAEWSASYFSLGDGAEPIAQDKGLGIPENLGPAGIHPTGLKTFTWFKRTFNTHAYYTEYEKKDREVLFTWDPVEGANGYVLEIANDEGFTLGKQRYIVRETNKSVMLDYSLKKYYWKVSAAKLPEGDREPAATETPQMVGLPSETETLTFTDLGMWEVGIAPTFSYLKVSQTATLTNNTIKDGSGSTFSPLGAEVVAEWRAPKYLWKPPRITWGAELDVSWQKVSPKFSSTGYTTQAVNMNILRAGIGMALRSRIYKNIWLNLSIGARRSPRYQVNLSGSTFSAQVRNEFNAYERLFGMWEPLNRKISVRAGAESTQGFSGFPNVWSIAPFMDLRYRFKSMYWVGFKYTYLNTKLSLQIDTGSQIGSATVKNQEHNGGIFFGFFF